MTKENEITILYFYDPLCGWCYGFSEVIKQFWNNHKSDWHFEVISGGMVTGERIGPLSHIAPYLQKAYKTVEERTGVLFGKAYLDELFGEASMIMSSIEPGIVLSIFKSFQTGNDIAFASAIQRAIYYDGVAPTKMENFVPYAAQHGVSESDFEQRLKQPAYHDAILKDFDLSKRYGIQGFPTVVLKHQGENHLLAHGYADLHTLEVRARQILAVDFS
jgi:putative protein-disulfide isomerase